MSTEREERIISTTTTIIPPPSADGGSPPASTRRSKKPKKQKKHRAIGGQMTFWEHLGELRDRLIWSAIVVTVVAVLVFALYNRDIIRAFIDIAPADKRGNIKSLDILEGFTVYIETAFYAGLMVASPFLVYQLLAFLAPALEPESRPGEAGYEEEVKVLKSIRRGVLFSIPFVAVFFVAGIVFSYYVAVPSVVKFLLNYADGQFEQIAGIKSYVSIITKFLFWTGVVFEMPVVMFGLAKIGMFTWKSALKRWKIALVLSLVLAAFITPSPDPVTQLIVAGPIFALYFLGVLFARFA